MVVTCALVACDSPTARLGSLGDAGVTGDADAGDGGVVDDGGTTDADDPTDLVSMCGSMPVTLGDWERCYQKRWCEIVVNCSELNLYRDVDQCIALENGVEGGSRSFEVFERARAIGAGKASIDTDTFTQCLVETSPRRCATAAHPSACKRRFIGTVPDHQVCFSDIECVTPGATCDQPATCTESCCAGTCTPKAALGEHCEDLVDGCAPGLVCGTNQTCVDGDLGKHCAGPYDCAPGAWCSSGTCVAARKQGESCGVDTVCEGETRCLGLIRHAAPPTCQPITHAGDPCDWFCLGNLVCDLPLGSDFGTCKPIATHGHACSGQLPCLGVDQRCSGGVCVDRSTAGQTCVDGTCQPGLFCSDQLGATKPVCTAPLADGQSSCNQPSQCQSHVCGGDESANGSCRALQAACP